MGTMSNAGSVAGTRFVFWNRSAFGDGIAIDS